MHKIFFVRLFWRLFTHEQTSIASCNCLGIVCRIRYHLTRRHRLASEYLSTGHCPTNNVTCNIIMRILSQIHRKQRIEWNDELTRNQTLRLSNTFVKKTTPNETFENTKPTDFTENSERQHSWRHHRHTTGTQNKFFDSESSRLFTPTQLFSSRRYLSFEDHDITVFHVPCFEIFRWTPRGWNGFRCETALVDLKNQRRWTNGRVRLERVPAAIQIVVGIH